MTRFATSMALVAASLIPSCDREPLPLPAPADDIRPADQGIPAAPEVWIPAPPGMAAIIGGEIANGADRRRGWWTVEDFFYDIRETTVAEYQECVDAGVCRPRHAARWHPGYNPDTSRQPDRPIAAINWFQADLYCAFRNKRLPTLEEWLWALRGGEENRRYPWGDAPVTCERANLGSEPRGCGFNGPWPPGNAPAGISRDGLLDLAGNVAEWTSSNFNEERRAGTELPGSLLYLVGDTYFARIDVGHPQSWFHDHVREMNSYGTGVRCALDGPSGHGPIRITDRSNLPRRKTPDGPAKSAPSAERPP